MIHQYPYHVCMHNKNRYVQIRTKDGKVYDGFIASVDSQNVELAIPSGEMEQQLQGMPVQGMDYRQFGFFPGFFPRRRFLRQIIPLILLEELFFLPFFI